MGIDAIYWYSKIYLILKIKGQDYIIREKNPDGSYKTIDDGKEYVLKSVLNDSGTILPTVGIMVKFGLMDKKEAENFGSHWFSYICSKSKVLNKKMNYSDEFMKAYWLLKK